jgi:hypothetical protein
MSWLPMVSAAPLALCLYLLLGRDGLWRATTLRRRAAAGLAPIGAVVPAPSRLSDHPQRFGRTAGESRRNIRSAICKAPLMLLR